MIMHRRRIPAVLAGREELCFWLGTVLAEPYRASDREGFSSLRERELIAQGREGSRAGSAGLDRDLR